jgi:hypothetical protein
VAGSTLPPAALPGGVRRRHRVPVPAGVPPRSAPDVLQPGNGFKMVGPVASAVPTQMVDLHTGGDGPECLLVRPAMHHHPLPVDPLRAVAIPITAPLPQDALAWIDRAGNGSRTNRDHCPLPQRERSPVVDLWRDGFKMGDVHACLHVAEMVDLHSRGDWSAGTLVVPAVGHHQAARRSIPFQPVAAVVATLLPDPTAVVVDEVFGFHVLILGRGGDTPERSFHSAQPRELRSLARTRTTSRSGVPWNPKVRRRSFSR